MRRGRNWRTGTVPRWSGAQKRSRAWQRKRALYGAKIGAGAQGFQRRRAAQPEYGWALDLSTIARIWLRRQPRRARTAQPEAVRRELAVTHGGVDGNATHDRAGELCALLRRPIPAGDPTRQ